MASPPSPASARRVRRQHERDRAAALRASGARAPVRGRVGLGQITLIALCAGVALIVLVVLTGADRTATPASDIVPVRVEATAVMDGFALGAPEAPVTIDLYEDFQCPACRMWRESVFPPLVANEVADGAVRIVFHDMAFLGDESILAGRAAFAAAQQGRFWDFWSTLYANQGQQENAGAYTVDRLTTMASELGLDLGRFSTDMSSPAADASLVEARTAAAALGVQSTPSLVIDGQVLAGLTQYDEVQRRIAAAMP
jgi:protein-disulfide isomerase